MDDEEESRRPFVSLLVTSGASTPAAPDNGWTNLRGFAALDAAPCPSTRIGSSSRRRRPPATSGSRRRRWSDAPQLWRGARLAGWMSWQCCLRADPACLTGRRRWAKVRLWTQRTPTQARPGGIRIASRPFTATGTAKAGPMSAPLALPRRRAPDRQRARRQPYPAGGPRYRQRAIICGDRHGDPWRPDSDCRPRRRSWRLRDAGASRGSEPARTSRRRASSPREFLLAIGLTSVFLPLVVMVGAAVVIALVPGDERKPNPALLLDLKDRRSPLSAALLVGLSAVFIVGLPLFVDPRRGS